MREGENGAMRWLGRARGRDRAWDERGVCVAEDRAVICFLHGLRRTPQELTSGGWELRKGGHAQMACAALRLCNRRWEVVQNVESYVWIWG